MDAPFSRRVICECSCTYPQLPCTSATLGGELQHSQQCAQPQAQGQNQKHPLEAVQVPGWRPGFVRHAAAGPPLALQVSQLSSLTQLKDCHTEVLYEGRTYGEIDRFDFNNTVLTFIYLLALFNEILTWAASPKAVAMLYPLLPMTSWALTSSQCRATAKSRDTDSPIKAKWPSLARRTPSSIDETKLLVLSMCSKILRYTGLFEFWLKGGEIVEHKSWHMWSNAPVVLTSDTLF